MKDNLEAKFFNEIFEATRLEVRNLKTISFKVDSEIDNPSNINVVNCANFLKESNKKTKIYKTESQHQVIKSSKSVNVRYMLNNFVV